MVSSINSPTTTSGVRIGGRRLTAEIVRFTMEHYQISSTVSDLAIDDEDEFWKELEVCRHELKEFQRQPGPESGKLRMIAIGHSLGGLYIRNSLGLLYQANFFHPYYGALDPLVCYSPLHEILVILIQL